MTRVVKVALVTTPLVGAVIAIVMCSPGRGGLRATVSSVLFFDGIVVKNEAEFDWKDCQFIAEDGDTLTPYYLEKDIVPSKSELRIARSEFRGVDGSQPRRIYEIRSTCTTPTGPESFEGADAP